MTSTPDLGPRVSRLENDVAAIYEILSEIQAHLGGHDRRFDDHDKRFDQIDRRFDQVDETLAEILRRLPEAS